MSEHGGNAEHSALVTEVLKSISKLSYVRGWKRVVGLFYQVRFGEGGKVTAAIPVTVGIEGEGDIEIMLTRWDGVAIPGWIECKTGKAVQSQVQKDWQSFVESRGAIYILARRPEDPLPILNEWRNRGKP